jgi:GWxTD domain-containing protein
MKRSTWLTVVIVMMLLLMVVTVCTGSSGGVLPPDQTAAESPGTTDKTDTSRMLSKDSFYETARFIMTKQEDEIYRHLPDNEARKDFIEEFWNKRDPSPETEENENREEFAERIRYANKWFKEYSKGRGWDTQRGRILLQLGFPDRREFGEAEDIVRSGPLRNRGALISSKPIPMEIWSYYDYGLVLVFADKNETGRLLLEWVPPTLPYALDKAKFSLDLRDQRNLKHAFKFDVEYKIDHFKITVPVKKVSFEEKNGQMLIDFGIAVYVYRDNKKVDEIKIPKTLSLDKEKLLSMKKIEFNIPYLVKEKGKYYFDMVIEEKSTGSKFRDFASCKI